jgi:hypothetical protein
MDRAAVTQTLDENAASDHVESAHSSANKYDDL